MWDFITTNWTNVLLLVLVLACPLIHAFGHGHGRTRHGRDGGQR